MPHHARHRVPTPPDHTRRTLWMAFAVGVFAAARSTWVQVSRGAELESILLLSVANAAATGSLFALLVVGITSRRSSQRTR